MPISCRSIILVFLTGTLSFICFVASALAEEHLSIVEKQVYQKAAEEILPFDQNEVDQILTKAHEYCDAQLADEAKRNQFIIQEALESRRMICYMDNFSRFIVRDDWEGVKARGTELIKQCVEAHGKDKIDFCSDTAADYLYSRLFSQVPVPFQGADADEKILNAGADELAKAVRNNNTLFGSIGAFFSGIKLFSRLILMSSVYTCLGLFALYVLFKHMNL